MLANYINKYRQSRRQNAFLKPYFIYKANVCRYLQATMHMESLLQIAKLEHNTTELTMNLVFVLNHRFF